MGFTTIEVERFAGGVGTIEASDGASGSCVQNGSESHKVERAEAMRSKRSGERCRSAAQMMLLVFSHFRSSVVKALPPSVNRYADLESWRFVEPTDVRLDT